MPEKVSEKEIYRLWWEYLKRSEDFKFFCDWYQKAENGIDEDLPDLDIIDFNYDSISRFFYSYYAWEGLYTKSFDEWWKSQKDRITKIKEARKKNIIRDYYEDFEFDFQLCIDDFDEINIDEIEETGVREEPNIYEFKSLFESRLKNDPYRMIFVVNLDLHKTDEIIKAFERIIRTKKKDQESKSREIMFKARDLPLGRVRFDELKRYLDVYDLNKDGVKYKDIIKKIGTKSQKDLCDDPDTQRQFRRDCQKAKNVIHNAVFGEFPSTAKRQDQDKYEGDKLYNPEYQDRMNQFFERRSLRLVSRQLSNIG